MAVNLSPYGGVGAQFLDNSGNVLTGGKIYTYSAGTTTPQVTYTSSTGFIPHSNPIILDAAGRVPGGEIWLTDGLVYKFILRDANDVLIATYDNVIGINSNFVAYTSQQEIQTATAGQTVFTLTTMQYQPGTNNLSVFVDGVNQYGPGAQYAYLETDSTTVTFVNGLHVGAEVKFTTANPVSSNATDAENVSYTPPFAGSVSTNVEAKLAQTVSVKDFGAVGDGVTDDTVAIQNAFNSQNSVLIPYGTYKILNSIVISNSCNVYCEGTLLNFGSNSALKIAQTKDVAIYDLKIDLTNAAATAQGLEIAGGWFINLYKPKIIGANVGQTGIFIQTSNVPGTDYGAYLIEIFNANLTGTFGYGIQTQRTSTDVVFVTHLHIYDGWSKGANYGVYLRNAASFRIEGFVADTGIDGINIADSFDGILSPGELGPNTGYGINFGANCDGIQLINPSQAASGGTLGYMNNTTYTPQSLTQGNLKLFGSNTDQNYYAYVQSRFNNANSFNLAVKGGTFEVNLLKYGEGAGTDLNSDAAVYLNRNNVRVCGAGSLSGNLSFFPATDNGANLGSPSLRWGTVYAVTPTINTSDANQKQQIRSLYDAEKKVALKIKSALKAFKFNDAVQTKGNKARIHFGVIAQEVQEIFASEGLNADDYGLFCSDILENGTVRLGIRYDELFAFIISSI